MIIIWRTILIGLCCFAVAICYPYYANGAFTIMFAWALIAFFIMLILTLITRAIILGRSHIFNTLFDIALVIGFLYVLLNIFPLLDGKTPYIHLKKKIYPTSQEVEIGIENLGLTERKKDLDYLQEEIGEITNDLKQVKHLITQEHND